MKPNLKPGNGNNNGNGNKARDIGFYILLAVIVLAIVFTINKDTEAESLDSYSELVDLFNEEKVQSFRTEGSKIILDIRTDDDIEPVVERSYSLYSFSVFYEDFHLKYWGEKRWQLRRIQKC